MKLTESTIARTIGDDYISIPAHTTGNVEYRSDGTSGETDFTSEMYWLGIPLPEGAIYVELPPPRSARRPARKRAKPKRSERRGGG